MLKYRDWSKGKTMQKPHIKKYFLIPVLCASFFSCKSENIIFDLFGVLFEIPKISQIKLMGNLPLKYFFYDKKNPANIGTVFFDVLDGVKVSANYDSKENCAKARNRLMPPIMYMWQANKLNYNDALKNFNEHINLLDSQNFFSSKIEKSMIIRAGNAAFDLETRKKMYAPIAQGVEILKSCAAKRNSDGTKKNKLYVLSNMDYEMFDHLKTTYPEIFKLFDGVLISGETGTLKPDKRIYQELIKKYNLNASESIFIDDQEENIKGYLKDEPKVDNRGSESVGIVGILCKDFDLVRSTLEKIGVIDPLPFSIIRTISSTIARHPYLVAGTFIAGYLIIRNMNILLNNPFSRKIFNIKFN